MNNAEIRKNSLIHARIAQAVVDHPELESLASKIPDTLSLTSNFLKTYGSSDVRYTVKSILIRALLEDATVYKKGVLGPLTCGSIRRMSEFFINHPYKALEPSVGNFTSNYIPATIGNALGIPRINSNDFLYHFGVKPYILACNGEPPYSRVRVAINDSDDFSFLAPFYDSRCIDENKAAELLTGKTVQKQYEYYFDTPDESFNLGNIFAFTYYFLAADSRRGRIQNKLPCAVTNHLGIRAHSIPHLLVAIDLATLCWHGCLQISPKLNVRLNDQQQTFLGMLYAVSQHSPLVEQGLSKHSSFLLTRTLSDQIYERKQSKTFGFLTGIIFNVDRLLSGDLSRSRFDYFNAFYETIDDTELTNAVIHHFEQEDEHFARKLCTIMASYPERFVGINIRDSANSLFHAWHQANKGRDVHIALPSVAKYKLGVPEPVRKCDTTYGKRSTIKTSKRYYPRIPLLDEMLPTIT